MLVRSLVQMEEPVKLQVGSLRACMLCVDVCACVQCLLLAHAVQLVSVLLVLATRCALQPSLLITCL